MTNVGKQVPVVILCGGYGTRLGGDNHSRPKGLVAIGHRPILWHVMKIYSRFGFNRFILCLGFQGFQIKQYFLNYRHMISDFTLTTGPRETTAFHGDVEENWSITFAETGLDTNTGGRIKRIEKYIDTDYFHATYADGLANVDLHALVDFHRREKKIATMTAVRPVSNFGVLNFDAAGAAVGFQEKPQQEDWINGGFFVFGRKVFEHLTDNCVLENEPLAGLARSHQLAIFKHRGFWKCMDTFKDNYALNEIYKSSPCPPWEVRANEAAGGR